MQQAIFIAVFSDSREYIIVSPVTPGQANIKKEHVWNHNPCVSFFMQYVHLPRKYVINTWKMQKLELSFFATPLLL